MTRSLQTTATPKVQQVTAEYSHSFEADSFPKSLRHSSSPLVVETREFDPGWRLRFCTKRRTNGFYDWDTAFEREWISGAVIGFLLRSPLDDFIDPSFLRLSVTISQHAPDDVLPVWTITHNFTKQDLPLITQDEFFTICEKETTFSLVEYPIINASLKITMPLRTNSDICLNHFGTNTMIKRFLFKSMLGEPTFVDTRYFVFSRRTGSKVHTPRVVFGNSYFLKISSEYFEAAFRDNSFLESKETDLSGPYPESEQDYTDVYGYEEDSDLEEEEDEEEGLTPCSSVFTSPASPKPPELRVPKHLRGKTMIIKDFAFRTFQAFIFYIATGEVTFEPLSSDSHTRPKINFRVQHSVEYPEAPFSCSAKSMYRLADKLGIEPLQTLALQHIKNEISERTILSELFSEFTSWYPEVQKAEMDFLLAHYDSLKSTEAFKSAVSNLIMNDPSRARSLLIPLLTNVSGETRSE